jgi:hypothetical protein
MPQVLSGQAVPEGEPVLIEPIPGQNRVQTARSQYRPKDDFYSVVGSLRMDWTDPALAYSPDTCQCSVKSYTEKEFDRFLADVQGRWPDFTIYNPQGNRWTQNRLAIVRPDGQATYFERFSTNLQIDFDFTFPSTRRHSSSTIRFYPHTLRPVSARLYWITRGRETSSSSPISRTDQQPADQHRYGDSAPHSP